MVSTSKDHFYTPEDVFGAEQGMAIAIALWEPIDPSIGSLKVVSTEWGTDENGEDYF